MTQLTFHLVFDTEIINKHSFEVLKTFLIKKRFLNFDFEINFFFDSNMKNVLVFEYI